MSNKFHYFAVIRHLAVNAMNIKCLIIEDEPLASYILEQYIEQTPCLDAVSSVDETDCLNDQIRNLKPDIVFTDVNIMAISQQQISELTKLKGVLVIFTTAYSKRQVEEILGTDLSESGYLHKPISYKAFRKELGRMVNKKIPAEIYKDFYG